MTLTVELLDLGIVLRVLCFTAETFEGIGEVCGTLIGGGDGLQDETSFFFKVDRFEELTGAGRRSGGIVFGLGFLVRGAGLAGWA